MTLIGFRTLFYKEVLRFAKVYLQTLVAPIVTAGLYLLVFAHMLEGRMAVFEGVSYTQFLIPGLVMMTIIQNAFANSSSSLIQSKITGNLIFVLVTPLSNLEIFLAFVLAAVVRGVLAAGGVAAIGLWFAPLSVHSAGYVATFSVLAGIACGAIGIMAGIWAEKFDQMAGITNFVILPLSFLSGVFYSVHSLPPFWQTVSHLNPFFYMIDGFRYGFFGVGDAPPLLSLAVTSAFAALLASATLWLLHRGYKLRD